MTSTMVNVWAPYLRIHQYFDEIGGQTLQRNMVVEGTVSDQNDLPKGTFSCGTYRNNLFECEWDGGERVDIVPWDKIEAEMIDLDDPPLPTKFISLEIVNMTGEVDTAADEISGWINVGYEADVSMVVWPDDDNKEHIQVYTTTDDQGNYTYDFGSDEVDLLETDSDVIFYVQPDGNQVAIGWDLQVKVDISKNRVTGKVVPGEEVDIVVSDVSGIKGSASVVAEFRRFLWNTHI